METHSNSKPRVYVAGPISRPAGEVAHNVRKGIEAGDRLARAGFAPYIPHFSHFWNFLFPDHDNYDFWLGQDFAWLEVCDALVRLPGESFGADKEVEFAELLGIPIFYSVDDCIAQFQGVTI